jgi:putative peptidoglycan lipid II flippase
MPVDDNLEGLKQTLKDAISIVSLLIIPATIGAMAFSNEIVNLLFGRGAFTVEAIKMTGDALFYYSVGMIAYGLRDILSRAFYSLKDTKTPVITATIAVILNIVLNLILSRYIGIGGLALATSISSIVATVSLFFILRRRIGALGIKGLTMSVGKNVLASLIMVL